MMRKVVNLVELANKRKATQHVKESDAFEKQKQDILVVKESASITADADTRVKPQESQPILNARKRKLTKNKQPVKTFADHLSHSTSQSLPKENVCEKKVICSSLGVTSKKDSLPPSPKDGHGWSPAFVVGNRVVGVGDSICKSFEVATTLGRVFSLPKDVKRSANVSDVRLHKTAIQNLGMAINDIFEMEKRRDKMEKAARFVRVQKNQLENRLNCLNNEMSKKENDIVGLRLDITTLNKKVTDEQENVKVVEAKVSVLEAKNKKLTSELTKLKDDLKVSRTEFDKNCTKTLELHRKLKDARQKVLELHPHSQFKLGKDVGFRKGINQVADQLEYQKSCAFKEGWVQCLRKVGIPEGDSLFSDHSPVADPLEGMLEEVEEGDEPSESSLAIMNRIFAELEDDTESSGGLKM